MGWRGALFWRLRMLPPLDRSLNLLPETGVQGEGRWRGHTVGVPPVVHPAQGVVPKRGLEVGLEKDDPTALPAPCPVVQSQTAIPLDLGQDLLQRKGELLCLNFRRTNFYQVAFFLLLISITSYWSLGIDPEILRAIPAPPVPPPGPHRLRPALLPGEEGIRIPLPVLAPGVVPGHVLNHLKDEPSGEGAGDCTGKYINHAA